MYIWFLGYNSASESDVLSEIVASSTSQLTYTDHIAG